MLEDFALSRARAGQALLLGGVQGGVLTAVLMTGADLLSMRWALRGEEVLGPRLEDVLVALALLGAWATLIYLLGLAVIAAPLWRLLHKSGHRRVWHALLLGGVLTLAFDLLVTSADGEIIAVEWVGLLVFIAIGLWVAFFVWSFAYRRGPFQAPRHSNEPD